MQKSGYLYKKGAQSSTWQQRQVSLSIDSGTMKFFAEKSGNRIPKGQVCIKQGKLTLLNQADTGHQFSFEIRMEDMIGKSDEAIQTLSVDSQQQLDQWVEWIELTFTTERRKSTAGGETRRTSSSESLTESFKWSVVPGLSKDKDSFKQSILTSLFQAVDHEAAPPLSSDSAASLELPVSSPVASEPFSELPSPGRSSASEFADSEPSTRDTSTKDTPLTVLPSPAKPTTELLTLPLMDRPMKPLTRRPSKSSAKDLLGWTKDEDNANGVAAPPKAPSGSPSSKIVSSAEANTGIESPDGKALAAKLEAKLEATRKSFKPPNFKNLLNSNGFDLTARKNHAGSETASETDATAPSAGRTNTNTPLSLPTPREGGSNGIAAANARRSTTTPSPSLEHINVDGGEIAPALLQNADAMPVRRSFTKSPARRRASKKATHLAVDTASGVDSDASRPQTPTPRAQHSLTKHLNIKTRPTETVRMGYLFKLDTSSHDAADVGHDVWLTQFVSLDVTAGMMLIFAEINGKRIQRAKFDINMCSVKSIDQLFHSRLYSFKVTYKPEDPAEKKVTAVFAAEDEDALNYWLVSFEDCEEHFHTKHAATQAAQVAKLALESAPGSESNSPVPVSEPSTAEPSPVKRESVSVTQPTTPTPSEKLSGEAVAPVGVTASGKKMTPAALALQEKLAKRRASKSGTGTPVPSAASEIVAVESVEKEPSPPPSPPAAASSAALNPLAAALQARFAAAALKKVEPKPEPKQEPQAVPAPPPEERVTGSTSEDVLWGGGAEDPLLRVNTMNMDQMLSLELTQPTVLLPPLSDAPFTPMNATPFRAPAQTADDLPVAPPSVPLSIGNAQPPLAPVPAAAIAPLLAAPSVDLSAVKFSVQRVKYPAERLSRRIKIWYCSSGFSLSTAAEVEQFVKELRNTGDAVLTAFSEEKFDELQDWANLLAMLRKYEQKWAVNSPADPAKRLDGIAFDVTSASRTAAVKTKSTFTLKANLDTSLAAKQLAKEMGASEAALLEALPAALLSKKDDSVISQGLSLLNDDLTFAEDLILYQEEVINHLWGNFVDQKTLLESRDDTIVKLHAKVSQLESAAAVAASGKGSGAAIGAGGKKNPLSSISHPAGEQPSSWQEEKNQLVQAHYDAKVKLINEIQALRKALTPTAEQTFKDFKQSEYLRAALEEEVVNTHIHNDNLKAELAALKDKLHETEEEKAAMEAHWQEEVAKLRKEQERSVGQLKKDVDRATQQANRLKEEARRAAERPPSAPPVLTSSSYLTDGIGGESGGVATPSPLGTSSSAGFTDAVKVVKIVSRFASPTRGDENQKHASKTYVNNYASLHEDTAPPVKPEAVKVFNPYNYSTEFKEDAVVEVSPATESQAMQAKFEHFVNSMSFPHQGGQQNAHDQRPQNMGNAANGSSSVGSMRRDEFVDPEEDQDDSMPHWQHQPRASASQGFGVGQHQGSTKSAPGGLYQPTSYGLDSIQQQPQESSSGKSRPPNLALQASIRSQRLPPHASGVMSPLTPMTSGTRMRGPYSTAPSSPANPLVVSRSQVKLNNPYRAAMKNEVLSRPPASSTKMPGAYMAPHTVKYSVKPSDHEDTARTRAGTPGMGSGPPSPSVGYMSATKSTNKQHQLIKESAKDSFFKKYVIKENGL